MIKTFQQIKVDTVYDKILTKLKEAIATLPDKYKVDLYNDLRLRMYGRWNCEQNQPEIVTASGCGAKYGSVDKFDTIKVFSNLDDPISPLQKFNLIYACIEYSAVVEYYLKDLKNTDDVLDALECIKCHCK